MSILLGVTAILRCCLVAVFDACNSLLADAMGEGACGGAAAAAGSSDDLQGREFTESWVAESVSGSFHSEGAPILNHDLGKCPVGAWPHFLSQFCCSFYITFHCKCLSWVWAAEAWESQSQ